MGRRGPFLPDGQQGWYHEEHAQQNTADECFAELLHQNAFDDDARRRKHFKKELEVGATKLNARVGHFMVTTILGTRCPDGVTPIRDERVRGRLGELFLKARLGWREIALNQHEVAEKSKEQELIEVEEVRRRLKEKLRRLVPLPRNSGEPGKI